MTTTTAVDPARMDIGDADSDPTAALRRRSAAVLDAAAPPLLVLSNVLLPDLPTNVVDEVKVFPPFADRRPVGSCCSIAKPPSWSRRWTAVTPRRSPRCERVLAGSC